jgi:hypothetical protein
MNLQGVECDDVNWIHLAQDMVQWRGTVNTLMDIRAAQKLDISLPDSDY